MVDLTLGVTWRLLLCIGNGPDKAQQTVGN